MKNLSGIVTFAVIALGGYLMVGFLIERFWKQNVDTEIDEATLYARLLGVSPQATVLELEHALQRIVTMYSPEAVAHMRPQDQEMAAVRLQQAHRAFQFLLAQAQDRQSQ